MGRFKSRLDTVRQTYRLCRLGGMPEPAWLEPYLQLCKNEGLNPGQTSSNRPPNTRRIAFPEDRVIQSYYDKNPRAKNEAIDLSSFEPPSVKKLAIRTLQLMEQGVPRKKAQKQIEQEMFASGELKQHRPPSAIQQIQAEEERVLMAAIQERKKLQEASRAQKKLEQQSAFSL